MSKSQMSKSQISPFGRLGTKIPYVRLSVRLDSRSIIGAAILALSVDIYVTLRSRSISRDFTVTHVVGKATLPTEIQSTKLRNISNSVKPDVRVIG